MNKVLHTYDPEIFDLIIINAMKFYFLFTHLPIFYFFQVCVNHLGLFKQILAKWWDKCGCPSIYHMFPMYSYCSSMLCNCIFASKCVGGKKSSLWSNHHIHSNAQKSPTIICGMYWLPILHCLKEPYPISICTRFFQFSSLKHRIW